MTMPTRKEIHPVLLRVLRELGGRARARDVVPLVTQGFPQLTEQELAEPQANGKGNKWTNRVRWARQDLLISGLLDGTERGWWKLAEIEDKQQSHVVVSNSALGPEEEEPPLADPAEEPPPFRIVPDPTEAIAVELEVAALDSGSPRRLEEAVKEAMEHLGFDAWMIGGSGQTDVLASAPLGLNRYSIVLDAKSTASGRVGMGQVDLLSIRRHREENQANYACIVGPGFADGELPERAREFQACLLTTSTLAELVRLHGEEPATLTELRSVFSESPFGERAMERIHTAATDRRRHRQLLRRILRLIQEFNLNQPNVVLAKPDSILAVISTEHPQGTSWATLEDVTRALSILEVLGIIAPAESGGYTSQTSLKGALDLLEAFGSVRRAADSHTDDEGTLSRSEHGSAQAR